MTLTNLIKTRVSQKTYLDQEVQRSLIEELLDTSLYVPNHKMREPWRFIIIDGKQKEVLKTRYLEQLPKDHVEDIEKQIDKIFKAPTIIAFLMPLSLDYDDEIEDLQANAMLIQNFLLLANEKGLSTHLKTPLFIKTDLFKSILGVNPREIVSALVMVGYADKNSAAKRRTPAAELLSYYK
ncbi:nitroreductase family protein [Mariniplasma anaerobium]|uniref:Putative NAD(P)H nitroreductase YfhC n=1 Tax=Mariniplasma anaerobium TaxID=2735436 RepID=A0A7U9THD6_9MOLU|nr:nitroreductase family protein [Mariniplasma anaerobium]BCR35866.1 putative NAD(P)H nitroreductase YfhC [Mariniplasma anaerobium]